MDRNIAAKLKEYANNAEEQTINLNRKNTNLPEEGGKIIISPGINESTN
jgi:hypothetical protein